MGTLAAANAYTGVWHTNPIYLAAIDRQVAPGGRTTYVDARTAKYTARDKTTFIAGQADWCADQLPDILKMISPPALWDVWNNTHKPELRRTGGGAIQMERWPEPGRASRALRRFDVLPDQIYSHEPGWVIEAWMRLDPTMQYEDILMRMRRPERPATFNPINMRRLRARDEFELILWQRRSVRGNANERTERILASLPAHQVTANSTVAPPNAAPAAYVASPSAAPSRMPASVPIGPASTIIIQAPPEGTTRRRQRRNGRNSARSERIARTNRRRATPATPKPEAPTIFHPHLGLRVLQQGTPLLGRQPYLLSPAAHLYAAQLYGAPLPAALHSTASVPAARHSAAPAPATPYYANSASTARRYSTPTPEGPATSNGAIPTITIAEHDEQPRSYKTEEIIPDLRNDELSRMGGIPYPDIPDTSDPRSARRDGSTPPSVHGRPLDRWPLTYSRADTETTKRLAGK